MYPLYWFGTPFSRGALDGFGGLAARNYVADAVVTGTLCGVGEGNQDFR